MLRFVTNAIEDVIERPIDIGLSTPISAVCDSLDIIEVSMYIEDNLGIIITDQTMASWKTIDDIVNYVSRHSRKSSMITLIQRFDEIASCLLSIGALETVRETIPVNELHHIDTAIQEHIESLFHLIDEVLDESEFANRVTQQAETEARGHRLMLRQRNPNGATPGTVY